MKSPSFCARCGQGSKRLADHFPYRSMRPFQREVLDRIESALPSTKFIVLEAPVGFGKSAVAAALCRYLGSAHILTSTKQLQDQYASDFGFPVVKGKSNFRCCVPTAEGVRPQCNRGRCEVDWKLADCPHYLSFDQYDRHRAGACNGNSKCEHMGRLCPYYEQKWDGFREPVTVCNYPFFLSELKFAGDIPHRRLLVCDEVHDLEKQMVGFASFALRRSVLQRYRGEPAIPDRGLENPAAWLDVLTSVRDMLDGFYEGHAGDESAQDRLASCRDLLEALQRFMDDLKADPANWVVNSVRRAPGGSVEEVVFQPVVVGGYTRQLFLSADSVLMMSATVFPKKMLCETLGMEEKDMCYVGVGESAFPVENRPIYALNTAQLNRASMESSFASLAGVVDEIMNRHAGQRGVIHTTSYQQVNYLIQHVSEANRERLVTTEGGFERSSLLRIHGSTGGSVLISPSLFQGVDLKDDMSRFQVIVKVPYPDLSERRTAVKLRRDAGWYDWQTALRLVQTYGRSVRSETDHAVTYVLDSNFTRFVGAHRGLFPAYFLEALRDGADLR